MGKIRIIVLMTLGLYACGDRSVSSQSHEGSHSLITLVGSPVFSSRSLCYAVVTDKPSYCGGDRDCLALLSGKSIYCSSRDCRAMIRGNASWCQSSDCRAVIQGRSTSCLSSNCRAIIEGKSLLCQDYRR